MNTNTRIALTDSLPDMIAKMADGNPGGLTVMLRLVKANASVDPMDWAGPFGPLLSLDAHGIYGSRIWMLYKDVCKENIVNVLALLRCCQMGLVAEGDMYHAIDNRGEGINLPFLFEKLKDELPEFNFNYQES